MSDAAPQPPRQRWRWLGGVLLLLIYASILLFTTFHHEAWYDETEPWLVARDASLVNLYHITPAIGVPALWFLLLMPAAKLGAPLAAMGIINALLAIAAIAVFLRYSPFPAVLKIAFTFGFFALFEFGVIARPYALLMLLIFAVAALHPHRSDRPIAYALCIALLANATPHSIVFAAVLAALFAWDTLRDPVRRTRRALLAIGLMFIAGVVAAIQLRPQADSQLPTYASVQFPEAGQRVLQTLFYFPFHDRLIFAEISQIVALLAIAALLVGVLDRPRALLIFIISGGWLAYLFYFKWFEAPRHSGIVLLLIVMTLWIALSEKRGGDRLGHSIVRIFAGARTASIALLTLGLAIGSYHAIRWVVADIRRPFSEAAEMAGWIRSHVPRGAIIAGDPFAGTVSAHLGRDWPFWLTARQEFGTFHTWTGEASRQNEQMIADPTLNPLRADATLAGQPYLLLLSFELPPTTDPSDYQLIYATTGRRLGYYYEAEQYYLYRRADGADGE